MPPHGLHVVLNGLHHLQECGHSRVRPRSIPSLDVVQDVLRGSHEPAAVLHHGNVHGDEPKLGLATVEGADQLDILRLQRQRIVLHGKVV